MNKSVINMAFAAFFGLCIGLVAGRYNQTNDIGFVGQPMGNQKPVYAANGLPDNCRAIIKENVQYYRNGTYSTDQIMDSIDRNCGEFGHSWGVP